MFQWVHFKVLTILAGGEYQSPNLDDMLDRTIRFAVYAIRSGLWPEQKERLVRWITEADAIQRYVDEAAERTRAREAEA